MKKNMGLIDRGVRLVIAAVLIALYSVGTISGTIGIVALVFAGIFILTSLAGSCPLYIPLGLSTKEKVK
jgi:hypothetical protein